MINFDESDDKAMDVALARAARAYEASWRGRSRATPSRAASPASPRIQRPGEPGASEIMMNLFEADYLMKNDLIYIGSLETVAEKIQASAEEGLFNVIMGEFNFGDLPEEDLLRSIRLFGERCFRHGTHYEHCSSTAAAISVTSFPMARRRRACAIASTAWR